MNTNFLPVKPPLDYHQQFIKRVEELPQRKFNIQEKLLIDKTDFANHAQGLYELQLRLSKLPEVFKKILERVAEARDYLIKSKKEYKDKLTKMNLQEQEAITEEIPEQDF